MRLVKRESMSTAQTAPWSLMTSNATAMAPDVAMRRPRAGEGQTESRFSDALTQAEGAKKAPQSYQTPQRPEDRMPQPVAANSQVFAARDEGTFTDYRRFTSADPTSVDVAAANRADEASEATGKNFCGEDGLTLGDVVDIVNPLQHIPIVSSVYRYVTGDEISPGAQLAGGSIYGGPIGFASSLANVIMKDQTGDDMGGTALTALFGAPGTSDTGTALAQDGAQKASVQTAQLDPESQNGADQAVQNGVSPLFAAQPGLNAAGQRSAPFAATPVGSPIASVQPILPGQNSVTSGANPQSSPGTAAAQGVPNLSADAATALMRMAQNSQPKNSQSMNSQSMNTLSDNSQPPSATPSNQASQSALPNQNTTTIKHLPGSDAEPKFFSLRNAPVAPTQLPSHSGITPPPPTPSAPSPAGTADSTIVADNSDAPEFLEPVPSKDLPSAMMDALAKYEKMKSPS